MTATQLLIWGIVIHLVIDWLLQSDWMATNKSNPHHISAYVHSLMHGLGLLLIFPWWMALTLAVLHFLIDLRTPLIWWRRFYRQTRDPANPVSLHVAMWGDQVTHILCLALAALLVGKGL